MKNKTFKKFTPQCGNPEHGCGNTMLKKPQHCLLAASAIVIQAAHKFLSKDLGRKRHRGVKLNNFLIHNSSHLPTFWSGPCMVSYQKSLQQLFPTFPSSFNLFPAVDSSSSELKAQTIHLDSAPLHEGRCGFRLDAAEIDASSFVVERAEPKKCTYNRVLPARPPGKSSSSFWQLWHCSSTPQNHLSAGWWKGSRKFFQKL